MIETYILFDDKFYISNYGNVKTLEGTIIDFTNRKSRYLTYKGIAIHRAVAITFLNNDLNKREVNHIDGNKHNNHVSNLEWVTTSENRLHAFKTGLQKPTYGYKGHHRTEREKELISLHNSRYWKNKSRSLETKEKISIKLRGKKHSDIHKLHQSEAVKRWWKQRKEGG